MPYYPYNQAPIYPPMSTPAYGQPLDQQRNMQQAMQQPMQQPTLLGRAVCDIAEARAVPSDLSGQPMFFPDFAHNAIHVKVFNSNTGAGDFYTFVRAPEAPQPVQQAAQQAQVRYALADDVESLRGDVAALRSTISRMSGQEVQPHE